MAYRMKLLEGPFMAIEKGKKIIELRLYDEKRRALALGDEITFYKLPELKETLKVKITGLLPYNSFEELFKDIPLEYAGFQGVTLEEALNSMAEIYSRENERKYGVLGIRIEIVKA